MTLLHVSDASIDKALFAKISPRKLVSLTTHSGNIRVVSITDFVETIEFKPNQGYTVERVLTYAELDTNGQWFWDRDASKLYVYCSAALPYKIIVIISLFVTTTFDVLLPCDPDDQNNYDKTVWRNRLQETSFVQSCDDQLNGRIGISSTSISLINNDSYYNYLATDSISFKNAAVKVWVIINDFANRILIFRGVCENGTFSSKELVLAVIEFNKILQKEATFGDTATWSTSNKAKWSDVKQQDEGKIIPFIFGNSTCYVSRETKGKYDVFTGTESEKPEFSFPDVDPESDIKPIFLKNRTTGVKGKQYVIGRTDPYSTLLFYPTTTDWSSRKTFPSGYIAASNISISKSNTTEGLNSEFKITVSGVERFTDFYIGQYLMIVSTSPDESYQVEIIVTEFNSIDNYIKVRRRNVLCTNYTLGTDGLGSYNNFKLVYWNPTVYTLKNGTPVFLDDSQYDIEYETTDGGNRIWYLIIKSFYNVNAAINYQYLDNKLINKWDLYPVVGDNPDVDYPDQIPDLDFYIRAYVSTKGVAQVLNYAANKCTGLISDSAAPNMVITSSNQDFTSFHRFNYELASTNYLATISPAVGSDKFETYLDIFEKCLSSSFGFCCISRLNKLIVRIFNNSPYGSELLELTEDDIKDGSVSSDIDFSEICSKIYGKSLHTMDGDVISYSLDTEMLSGEISKTFESASSAKYYYDLWVKPRVEAFRNAPIKRYTFSIINKGYDLTLGDRIAIRFDNSGRWLGADTTKNLFVVKINKALSGVNITAIENIFPAPKA